MARGLALVPLLAVLLLAGWFVTAQSSRAPSRGTATQAVEQAGMAAAGVSLQQAETQLEQFHALNHTYAGAPLAGFGVTLVRAGADSYCIQAGGGTSHLIGPGGSPAAGSC
jgi:Tfp pilus assembly protein PilE